MKRHWAYLKYVLRHKWYVFKACLMLGVPLWIAIFHDWDKFMLNEWFPYARCFYKPDGSTQYDETPEFSYAWMLHQHRNKHHWQWWLSVSRNRSRYVQLSKTNILVGDDGAVREVTKNDSHGISRYGVSAPNGLTDIEYTPMSDVYRREMLADWIGAGEALGKPNTWEWYESNKGKIHLHPDTRAWVEKQMELLEQTARTEKAFKAGFFG